MASIKAWFLDLLARVWKPGAAVVAAYFAGEYGLAEAVFRLVF